MPRYWKNGRRELRIVRNDCYRIDKKYLYFKGSS